MEKRKKGTVSLRDVAKTAKCSHTTVSLALRGDSSIPPATQKRILQIAHKMGYKRDPYATALMTLMRGKRPTGIRAEIGWIHAIQPDMGVHHPANINMLKGARARALELGYRLCELTPLGSDPISLKRLLQILRTRRIQGVVIAHAFKLHRIPYFNRFPWEDFSVAIIGDIHPKIAVSCIVTDYVTTGLMIRRECLRRGYRRIGFAIPKIIDGYSGGRWNMLIDHVMIHSSPSNRIRPYQEVDRWDQDAFLNWVNTSRPDVLVTNDPNLFNILKENAYRIPKDLGFVTSGLWSEEPIITGTILYPEKQGAAAVDIVDAQIRRGEKGPVENPKILSISPSWNEGNSLAAKT